MGTHSWIETLNAAKKLGLKTICVSEEGRHEDAADTYSYNVDELIVIKSFKQFSNPNLVRELHDQSAILVPHRGISAYLTQSQYENDLALPMVGSRDILRIEDRNQADNQTDWLRAAGINTPRVFKRPEDIDRLVIIKVQDKNQPLERAFFYAKDYEDYQISAEELIKDDAISKVDLDKAEIQEAIIGAYFNIVFCNNPLAHYSPFKKTEDRWEKERQKGQLQILGLGQRIQTDLDGFLRLRAADQLKLKTIPQNIECGHTYCTARTSDEPKMVKACRQFVNYCATRSKLGFIGVGGLQGVLDKYRRYYVFDTAPRTPGDRASIIAPQTEWQGLNMHGTGQATMAMITTALNLDKATNSNSRVNLARIVT